MKKTAIGEWERKKDRERKAIDKGQILTQSSPGELKLIPLRKR